jgi:hypothetical protein
MFPLFRLSSGDVSRHSPTSPAAVGEHAYRVLRARDSLGVTLSISVREVLASNLGQETGNPD